MNSTLEKLSLDRKSSSRSASFFPTKTAQERTGRVGKRGAEAGRLLARPGFSGKVLASLPGTVYIMDDEEEILWLSTDRFPMHRRCLQVSFLPAPHFLWPGQRLFVQNSALRVGDFCLIDLRSLKDWTPPTFSLGQANPLAEVRYRRDQFFGFIRCLGSLEGVGRLIPLIFKMAEGKEVSLTPPDSATARFLTPIIEIGKACLGRNMAKILEKGEDLIGLGPGLTPSGDDFLGGLLFSAGVLRKTYPAVFLWDRDRISDFTAWAKPRTNPISHSFLNDFALGHGPAPLHEVMRFLIQGDDFEKAVAAVSQFLRFGHSSGGDILTGLMTGMLMVFEMKELGSPWRR
jgi:hypothetical protein